jgi:PAS domain-containing protein
MSATTENATRFRDFAFAAADLMVAADASGRIIDAEGDATLLFHPTADRLIGRNAIELISGAEGNRLREELWALGPGRRVSWEDPTSIEGGRRIVVQRSTVSPNSFSFAISRMPNTTRIRAERADEILAERFRDAGSLVDDGLGR